MISDISVSSASELVTEVIWAIDEASNFDKTMAVCLFTGIMTDTGCFNFNSSQPATFTMVSKLLNYNIDKDTIVRNVYDNFSAWRMRLLGYCLNEKMVVLPEYKTAYIWITIEEMKKYNFSHGDSEGFVNYPLSINGINFSAFFMEKEDRIKISFRSRGGFNVNHFSRKHFNGGGHKNASGGFSFISMDKTLERFNRIIPDYLNELQ
jgi:bifunctional oligoribonuclease and PAP phosphatase NrnA